MTTAPATPGKATTCALAARRRDGISVPAGPAREDGPAPASDKAATGWWSGTRPLHPEDLAADMGRAIVRHAGGEAADPLLAEVIQASIEAFLGYAGHPVAAAESVSDRLHRIGSREAALGRSFDILSGSFQVAREAVEAHLPRLLVRHPLPADKVALLRDDLGVFLDRLLRHAREGFERRWALGEMPPELARAALRRALFEPVSALGAAEIAAYVDRADLDAEHDWVAVVRLDAPLRVTPGTPALLGLDPHEALLPDPGLVDELVGPPSEETLLVVGPAERLVDARRAIRLARRTAGLVGSGLVTAPAGPLRVVRTEDVMGALVTFADPHLGDLLVARHLGPLQALDPGRRLDLAEPLLAWLESGCAVSKLARDLGYHEQTLHHRFRRIRELYPPTVLDDPHQRFELVVALRHAMPRWRQERR